MGKIRILSDELANQVAAGEVVERPASIVKELAENSLDAGATRIIIDFAKGGARAIAVRDDGCGMDREDALLSLERHATSKLRSAADIHSVTTMGFRGEALPSIASVSRFRLVTRQHGHDAGTEILVTGGRVQSVKEAGAPPGTLIEARDLFFNIPARMKFLRGEETESAQILQVVYGLALSAPGVSIECRRDGREVLRAPAGESLETRIRDLFGAKFLARLLALKLPGEERIEISGFVSRPGEGRRDRLQQFVVINGRPVTSAEVSAALREAFTGHLPPGLQPLAVLTLSMPPELVDCNAHPAKRQVRFSNPEEIRRAVFDAVTASLPSHAGEVRSARPVAMIFPPPEPQLPMDANRPTTEHTGSEPGPKPPQSPPPAARSTEGDFRVIGGFGRGYFALEGPEGLVILDSRAARERIAFELLLRQIESGEAPCQRLLLPEVIELPAREHAWIVENIEPLRSAGFLIESFGGLSIKIEGVPSAALGSGAESLLHEVAASLRAAGRLLRGHGLHELLARTVTRCAGGGALPPDNAAAAMLVVELLRCELPYASPLGSPTLIQFSYAELDRRFGRAG